MRVGATTLVALGAVVALVGLAVTDQVLPASSPRVQEMRPWIAARALGVTAYLLLALEVASGLVLSHPRNTAEWRKTRQVFPWHEMFTVFTFAFIGLHVVLLAVDPFAKVGWLGALVPGFSGYQAPAIALGTVAMYALLFTAVTAKWTRLLPAGWWLKAHRFAAIAFLLTWTHSVLAGTDGGALMPLYLVTGLLIVAGVAHRWWTARVRPQRADRPVAPATSLVRPVPASVPLEEIMMSRETLVRLGRRVIVLAATVAVIGVGVGVVQVSAQWRAEAAPLDTAPASMTEIGDDYAIETERAADLATQMDGVAGQISGLQAALITANGSIDDDTQAATELQGQLAAAKVKLTVLEKQLNVAQKRLEQLNKAASRQAALNRAAATRSGGGGGSRPAATPRHEEEEDDD